MVAVLLRVGLGVSLLNGGLLGYLTAQRGGTSPSNLAMSTLLGPASVGGLLERDLLVPYVQIALGLALILGFFTVISAIGAGFLLLSAPIFQFLAVLSTTGPPGTSGLEAEAMTITSWSINLLLLDASVLWLTPMEGTHWSLDALIFSHRKRGGGGGAGLLPGKTSVRVPVAGEMPRDVPPSDARTNAINANRGE